MRCGQRLSDVLALRRGALNAEQPLRRRIPVAHGVALQRDDRVAGVLDDTRSASRLGDSGTGRFGGGARPPASPGSGWAAHTALAALSTHCSSLSPAATWRCHLRQEPDAVVPHVRI